MIITLLTCTALCGVMSRLAVSAIMRTIDQVRDEQADQRDAMARIAQVGVVQLQHLKHMDEGSGPQRLPRLN